MDRRSFLTAAAAGISAIAINGCIAEGQKQQNLAEKKPNFILILMDDMGYGDTGPFNPDINYTPNMNRLAEKGKIFTDFYMAASVCAPSRAAIMTGSYPQRVGLSWNINADMTAGLSPEEITMPEMLKARDYKTACIGKWHLGHEPQFLPTSQGFDEFWGLPYSHDMKPESAKIYKIWAEVIEKWPPLRLLHNYDTVEINPDPDKLTTFYTEKTLEFIRANKSEPFMIYLAHSMPHVPLGVSEKFRGKSGRGLYADVIMELDWSIGQIADELTNLGIDEDTLIVITSDNGPWAVMGNHAGSTGLLRGEKSTSFEGGHCVPCIMHWPGKIKPDTLCSEPVTSMDIYPTFAKLSGVRLPGYKLDGRDITPLLLDKPGAKSPHDKIFFYHNKKLEAVRSGKWKLYVPHGYNYTAVPGKDGLMGKYNQKNMPLSLYNLDSDPGETNNIADRHPDIIRRLLNNLEQMRTELGDTLEGVPGRNIRRTNDIKQY